MSAVLTPTISVREYAKSRGISVDKVLSWIRTGQLAAINVGLRPDAARARWRIPLDAIEAFETARTPVPQPVRPRGRPRKSTDVVQFFK